MHVAGKTIGQVDEGHFKNSKVSHVLLVAVSFSINLLSLALPITMLHFYDRILPGQNISTMIVLVATVILAILVESILKFIRSYMLIWSGTFFEYDVACRAINNYVNADLRESEAKGSGEYLQKINSVSKLKEFYSGSLIQNYIDLGFVVIFFAIIAYLSGWLVFVPLSLLGLLVASLYLFGSKYNSQLYNKETCDDSRYDFIIESLRGMHTIKSLGLEPIFARRYEKMEEDSTFANHKTSLSAAIAGSYSSFFNQVMIVAIVFFGALMTLDGKITMGTLVAVVLLTGRTIPPIQRAVMIWLKWHEFSMAKENVESFFKLLPIKRMKVNKDIPKPGTIEVQDLCFSYNKEDDLIIDHLNLEVQAGSTISVSGGYSCGKTTLLQLFAGLIKPNEGSVIIDGVEAHKYPDKELGKHVAYMSTDIQIFKGTIRENLTAFRKGDLEEKALELARMLNLDKEIAKLPEGYDSMLNDTHSDPISPGLKQRIAIARVLALKPKLILFDNADKSLDKEGYKYIVRLIGLLKGKATIIIVSDDRNLLGFADKEYVLEDGNISERQFDADSKFYDLKPNQEFKL